MKRSLILAISALALGMLSSARAQTEVTLIAPGGIRAAIERLIPGFEKKTGYMVKATFGSGLGTKGQVARGEGFDVPIVQPPYPEVLASGHVVPDSAKPLASVALGMAVRHGAPKPDISTPEKVKQVLLSAKSVSYPNPAGGAAAGVTFDKTLKELGISAQMESKLKRAQGGNRAMEMVANGDVEIGLTFVSEMKEPGIDVVGALPSSIAPPTNLVGFISAHTKNRAAAEALLNYLGSPEAASSYRAEGMEPAHH